MTERFAGGCVQTGVKNEWSGRGRLLFLLAALAATIPAWPYVQPHSPILDEMLRPAEVAVLVPVVLLFPVAWALLGRTWKAGVPLVLLVAGWSVGTVRFASYATPPTVDDFLRWYLVAAGLTVLVAMIVTRTGVRRIGFLVFLAGCAAAVAVPFVGEPPTPPGASLPPGVVADENRLDCNNVACTRVITVRASDTADARTLTRRIGEHLERTEGWRMRWYPFTAEPDIECKSSHRPTDPYALCLQLRSIGDPDASVQVRLSYSNRHDPVYRPAS
ncbi:hypothetical protein [Actinoplanes regularis]|uniref:hypothetical protein n=1 Tax=Actinoplanes regularis TaxID=52697 RepID=UPI002554EDB1|nr:hypothetical protein [Actinoplanes regularis]GLW27891.1 hypothetical protein Areg01_08310 [Actinoplanes regularis]